MDNNNNQNKNGKNPKGGQNYMVLIITMIFTLLCVSAMHNLWPVSYTHLLDNMRWHAIKMMEYDEEVCNCLLYTSFYLVFSKDAIGKTAFLQSDKLPFTNADVRELLLLETEIGRVKSFN